MAAKSAVCGIFLFACALSVLLGSCSLARPAPELLGTTPVNTRKPISLAKLRGKIVVLDFWSYSCVNCLKTIQPLRKLEKQFADQVIFIGVHTPKYDSEKPEQAIRSAIKRFGIDHAVVNDPDGIAWKNYGVEMWPTFVVIDTQGGIAAQFTTDNCLPALEGTLSRLVAQEMQDHQLSRQRSSRLVKVMPIETNGFLTAPGKVCCDPASHRLFLSNTGRNQIVAVRMNGKQGEVETVIGSGLAGLKDGSFADCQFNHPEGLAFDGGKLYVADTDNHAVRVIDFDPARVSTMTGNGVRSNSNTDDSRPLATANLDSPWDLVWLGRKLYVAMAGAHQIWCIDPARSCITKVAGSGAESSTDGRGTAAAFAQPSGITTDGHTLYIADTEDNGLRQLDPDGMRVTTVAGKGLTVCGDEDGPCSQALFRHPEGLTFSNGKLIVADSFNNKIKSVDLDSKTVSSVSGSGVAGAEDGAFPAYNEPSGVCVMDGCLFVADSGNDAIRVIDLANLSATTLKLEAKETRARKQDG